MILMNDSVDSENLWTNYLAVHDNLNMGLDEFLFNPL